MYNFEKWTSTFGKNVILLHNLKLASHDFLHFLNFVSIFFYYLNLKVFRRFSHYHIKIVNG